MSDTIRVAFDVIRHGQSDDDMLTQRGRRQVTASVNTHLAGRRYRLSCHPGSTKRTFATLDIAYGCLSISPLSMVLKHQEEGFGPHWLDDTRWPKSEAENRIAARVANGEPETVALWLEEWPLAQALRGRFLAALGKWAMAFAIQHNHKPTNEDNETRILVASHSPCAELACIGPNITEILGFADGITYEMEIDCSTFLTKMTSSEVWRCPAKID